MRALLALSWLAASLFAQDAPKFRTVALFGDHMVLPKSTNVPLRGFGPAGEAVTAEASWGVQAEAEVGADGRWNMILPTDATDGPHSVRLQCGSDTVEIADVLFGEVWLASGQSNMEWRLPAAGDADREIAAAKFPQLRMFTVERATAGSPNTDVVGKWLVCTPENAPEFSAVAYHFARELQAARKAPIGVVASSWGGTVCEAWTSPTALAAFPEFAEALAATRDDGKREASLDKRRAAFWRGVEKADVKGETTTVSLPDVWSRSGLGDFDGIATYERVVELPAAWRGAMLTVSLGAIDDMDTVWCDGERIGGMEKDGAWSTERNYLIPAERTAGKERITLKVRVVDTGGEGGLNAAPEAFALLAADGGQLAIADGWQRTRGAAMGRLPKWPSDGAGEPNRPAVLYHAMIAPLAPFPFAGAIWYQGESNRGRHEQYAKLFPALIQDWRRTFASKLPFYFVQIAPFGYRGDTGEAAALRLAQEAALQLPDTGMVVTLDVGDPDNIHPADKRTVGKRLALQARAKLYGEAIGCDGPRAGKVVKEGAGLRVTFEGCSGTLVLREPVGGFEIAGNDGVWKPSQVREKGLTILFRHPEIAEPTQVRYAWASAPSASLWDEAMLPARPFWLRVE
ncbi:MAG: hypothetical protein RL398_3273 [Planctomycetota bacterium]|jgi:sialate O-acetylesterase